MPNNHPPGFIDSVKANAWFCLLKISHDSTQEYLKKAHFPYDEKGKPKNESGSIGTERRDLKAKARLRRRNNPEPERQRKRLWRASNRDKVRTYGLIQHYRKKQRELALQYLKNGDFRPCKDRIFHSVPTFAPSDLLGRDVAV